VGYRETERRDWNIRNTAIIQRVRRLAFAVDMLQLEYVHVLDVMADGLIKPHIDSTRVSHVFYCYTAVFGTRNNLQFWKTN